MAWTEKFSWLKVSSPTILLWIHNKTNYIWDLVKIQFQWGRAEWLRKTEREREGNKVSCRKSFHGSQVRKDSTTTEEIQQINLKIAKVSFDLFASSVRSENSCNNSKLYSDCQVPVNELCHWKLMNWAPGKTRAPNCCRAHVPRWFASQQVQREPVNNLT